MAKHLLAVVGIVGMAAREVAIAVREPQGAVDELPHFQPLALITAQTMIAVNARAPIAQSA